MDVIDLGTLGYREAWLIQEQAHTEVQAGGPSRIYFVEHPPVITLGRRPGVERNLRVDAADLEKAGVQLVQSDRGGDITYHGPGQLVCYPIIRLADAALGVGDYVHGLERAVIRTLAPWNINATTDPSAVGVWCGEPPAKICAIGVRVRRGVSLHGLALNVSTDLSAFELIVPCGLVGRPVTSLQAVLHDRCPSMDVVKRAMAASLREWLDQPRECSVQETSEPVR